MYNAIPAMLQTVLDLYAYAFWILLALFCCRPPGADLPHFCCRIRLVYIFTTQNRADFCAEYTDKKKIAVAKSYMRKGFLIYEEMRKYFPIYE